MQAQHPIQRRIRDAFSLRMLEFPTFVWQKAEICNCFRDRNHVEQQAANGGGRVWLPPQSRRASFPTEILK